MKCVLFLNVSLDIYLYLNILTPSHTHPLTHSPPHILTSHTHPLTYSLHHTTPITPHSLRDESEVLPIAVPVLLSIPPDAHYAVRAATLRLVAVLAEWIDSHPDTLGEYIHHVLKIETLQIYNDVKMACQKYAYKVGRNDAKVKVNTQTLLYSTLSATVVFGRERGVWEHGVWEHGVWEHGV